MSGEYDALMSTSLSSPASPVWEIYSDQLNLFPVTVAVGTVVNGILFSSSKTKTYQLVSSNQLRVRTLNKTTLSWEITADINLPVGIANNSPRFQWIPKTDTIICYRSDTGGADSNFTWALFDTSTETFGSANSVATGCGNSASFVLTCFSSSSWMLGVAASVARTAGQAIAEGRVFDGSTWSTKVTVNADATYTYMNKPTSGLKAGGNFVFLVSKRNTAGSTIALAPYTSATLTGTYAAKTVQAGWSYVGEENLHQYTEDNTHGFAVDGSQTLYTTPDYTTYTTTGVVGIAAVSLGKNLWCNSPYWSGSHAIRTFPNTLIVFPPAAPTLPASPATVAYQLTQRYGEILLRGFHSAASGNLFISAR